MVETIQVAFWIVEYKLLCAGRKYLSVVTQISHFFVSECRLYKITKCFRLMTYPSKCQKHIGCSTAIYTVHSALANSRKRPKTCRDTHQVEDFFGKIQNPCQEYPLFFFFSFFLLVPSMKPGKLKLSKWAQILRGFRKS